jgi:hypothetical protein
VTDADRIAVVREIWAMAYERGVPPERVLDEYEHQAHERMRGRDTLPAPPPVGAIWAEGQRLIRSLRRPMQCDCDGCLNG